jgi:glycine betaine/choline ABC-type transport system substrate-binding protein
MLPNTRIKETTRASEIVFGSITEKSIDLAVERTGIAKTMLNATDPIINELPRDTFFRMAKRTMAKTTVILIIAGICSTNFICRFNHYSKEYIQL